MVGKRDSLAPAGCLEGPHQILADERSRSNSSRFRAMGLRCSTRYDVGDFLRRMTVHPERIAKGNHYGMPSLIPIRELIDHPRLYIRDRKPYAVILHTYARLHSDRLKALLDWTAEVGLDVCVDADSEYYPGVTLRIVLYRQGSEFPGADLV